MALAARSPSTSPFVSLLRRSKFATYDPEIAQVYTAYDGDARRGQYGFKRSVPLRRRNAFVTVGSVDTAEQQTDWRSGESQARWVRKVAEVGVERPMVVGMKKAGDMEERSAWVKRLAGKLGRLVDSEFALGDAPRDRSISVPSSLDTELERSSTLPNMEKMDDVQFSKFLNKLRGRREAFKEFIKNKDKPESSLFKHAHTPQGANDVSQFLLDDMSKNLDSSKRIEQRPHQFAGLAYTHAPRLQTYFLTKPQPGRILSFSRRTQSAWTDGGGGSFTVGFAGMTVNMPTPHAEGRANDFMAFGETGELNRTAEDTTSVFRVADARLITAPEVVARRPSGLRGVVLETDVKGVSKPSPYRTNTHQPGTPAYIAQQDFEDSSSSSRQGRAGPRPMVLPRKKLGAAKWEQHQPKAQAASSRQVLNRLQDILDRGNRGGEEGV